ncbi:GNAT family N-acetyltransferase [Legionella feeleii]|uniref:N-acetyltransferase ats1 n=1 Tax=Legionella feeleii TaxID=453 RepID=A0A378KT94_9GAMM|nr:GNAT family N-acetyltransferase [Legionella feeleii]STX88313.1 N-acetyltransferase ats1 [Legionella feeleii]
MQKTVRAATIEDFDFIYDSLREDLDEQGVLHRFKYTKDDFKDAVFGKSPKANFLILFIDGEPAGIANYSIDHRNFTANSLANLYVNDLFVKKPYRRMRGAAVLMEKIKQIAKEEGCGRIEGVVLSENTDALGFYENFLKAKIISDSLHYMRLELDD